VNPAERAEDAALLECREEIGWAPPEMAFLGSFPNSYEYGGVGYNTCDLYFYYSFPKGEALPSFAIGDGEARAIRLKPLDSALEADLAFSSLARALEAYRAIRKERGAL
jgi:8-oxo-dGTP pyrophosphatase MutT (NUDIX family)